jgi:hypothetical protein
MALSMRVVDATNDDKPPSHVHPCFLWTERS